MMLQRRPPATQAAGSSLEGRMINFILALVMGGIIGWLASKVMNTDAQQGLFLNVVVGCIGSMLGGWLFSFFTGGTQNMRDAPFNPITLAVAFGGAIVLLGVVNLIRRGKVR
jgi:uncharacterized membrane protein YeaQ/YmgE (transglycosylase-associated protein family)